MKKVGVESFELSTGRIIHPDCGADGLGKRWVIGFSLFEIDDNLFSYVLARDKDYDDPDLTKDEAKEVANYMIEMWAEFANSLT